MHIETNKNLDYRIDRPIKKEPLKKCTSGRNLTIKVKIEMQKEMLRKRKEKRKKIDKSLSISI